MSKPEAYGYIRVSTTMQKEDGISLDTQTKRINDYCAYRGFELKKIYSDAGKSGGTMERPALKDALNALSKGNYLIVAELSRLSRNTKDALNILELVKNKSAYLISLSPDIDFSSSIGEMMFTILLAFHQLERRQISERVSINMKNLSNQNLLRGKAPFGFKFISKELDMIPNEEQQNIIKKIVDMHSLGYSYNKISNCLNDDGDNKYLDESGEQIFYAQTVKNILADGKYIASNRKSLDKRFMGTRKKNLTI
jgi:site-specific DNA recombinase